MNKPTIHQKFAAVVKHRLANELTIEDIEKQTNKGVEADVLDGTIGVKLTVHDIEIEYESINH